MQQSKGDENLVRKTLITTLAMMGVSVVFVGGLSLIASAAAGRAVGAPSQSATETAAGTAAPGKAEPLAPAKALNRRGRGAAKGAESF